MGLCLTALGVITGSAFAESDNPKTSTGKKEYTPLAPLPGTTNSEGQVTLDSYIPGIFNLTIGIAGVLAVLMILIGGVEYITTDAIQGKQDGKGRISNALWGLILVLVSWILLYTINPKLTVFDLTIKESVSKEQESDTSDNPYINEGESATNLEQTSGSSSSVNKFKQEGSNSSKNEDVFVHPTTSE